MSFHFPLYAIGYLFTLVACATVAYIAWQRRSTPGSMTVVLLMLAVMEWALTAALEAAAIGIPAKVFWSKVEYLGTVSSPTLFLIFVLQYIRLDKWLTRRNVAWLWIIPTITLLMAATNEWHYLVWNSFTPSPAGSNILEYGHGTWFWINVIYAYAAVLASLLALIWAIVRSPNPYRQQAGTLLASALAPIVVNVLYVSQLIPVPGLEPTPIAFGLTGLILAWGIFRFRLFDLVPVARDVLIENMSDGVLVLDEQNRVADINPAARQLLGHTAASPIGQNVEGVLAAWPDLVERYRDVQEAQIEISVGQETPRYLDLRISRLHNRRRRFTGRLIVLRDVTERKQIENKLRQLSLAVEQSPASVVITDTSGSIEYVNPKFTQLTGYSFEEALGQNPRILKSGDKSAQEYKQLWDTLTSGGEWHGEFHNKKKNGELYWESAVISPITDAQGVITHFLAVKEDITEHKRAQEAERRWLQELEALRATLTDISGELELSRLLRAIVERVVALLEGEQGELALYDEAQNWLTSAVSFRQSRDYTGTRLALGEGIMGHIAQTRQSLIVEDYADWEGRSLQYHEQARSLTLLCAPLVSGQKLLGAIAVGADNHQRKFTPQDIRLIEMFAQQAAIAIQNARLYTDAAQHAEQMVTISRIGLATTSGLDMELVLQTLLQQCQQVLPIDAFYVDVYDDETDLLRCPLFYDRGKYRTVASYRMHSTPGLSGRVIVNRKTLYLPDMLDAETAQLYPFVSVGGEPTRSYVGVPLIAHDRVVGVISMQSYQPNAYSSEQIHMFETIATQAAIAIENSRLFEETRQRAERLALINEISIAINLSGELHAVLRTTADGLARVLNISQVGIALFDDTRQRLIVTVDHPAPGNSSAVGVELPIEGNLSIQHILSTQTPLAIEDAQNDPLMANVQGIMTRQRVRSILLVPLIARNQVIGTIGCDAIEAPRQFTPEEVKLAQTIAALVALRIEQARLFEAERMARQQAQRRATDLSGLYAIARATSRSLATEDVLSQALSSALVSLGYEAGLIALVEPGAPTSGLRLMAERGLPAALSQKFLTGGLANTLIARVYDQREIALIPDLEQEQSVAFSTRAAEMVAQGWKAFIGIPLIQQEQSRGVLCLFSRQSHLSAAHDLALLASIGHQVATAITNAQLFQATLNERSRLKALIESSRDGIILAALDGHIQIINAPALQILHLPGPPDDWIGIKLLDAINRLRDYAPEGFETAFAEIGRIRLGNEPPAEGEVQVPPRVIRWQSLPVKVGAEPMGRLIVLRDMTEERAVDRMREDMTHMMVHDLRNPLGGISSSLELLTSGMMGELAPHQLELLDIAYRSAQRMIGLVSSILDVSRLESGRMPIEPRAFNVGELVADTLQAQTALANERGLHLENTVPFALPCAWADRGLIHRVLDNLIGNACKFTPADGKVCVSASVDEQALPPILLISVNDTGQGIPPEIQSRLFQKFVTGGRQGSGSGLGLAFCKLAVEAHGGRIWVESVPGHGATFTFTLPVSTKDQ